MIRIGIFGAENSHAAAFSQLFDGANPAYPDMKVVVIGGEEPDAAEKIRDERGVKIVSSPEAMLGEIDAAMVTSRNGALHLRYAKTFIEAGLPTFVDKPIANDAREAEELIALSKAKGVPICGGSSVKLLPAVQEMKALREAEGVIGGYAYAPLNMHNPYGGFYFYSAHLVEMALEAFGMEVQSVRAVRKGDNVSALLRYADFDVPVQFMDGHYDYGITLHTPKSSALRAVTLDDCYACEAAEYMNMVKTGNMPIPHGQMIRSVYVLNAIEAAFQEGGEKAVGGVL